MKVNRQAAKHGEAQRRLRKAYTGPVLKEFGPVADLTQAGTGIRDENRPGRGSRSKRQ